MALIVLSALGAVSLLIWLGIFFHPARPWDFQPVGDDGGPPREVQVWPTVRALVPARNESESLPHTLPALLRQDYPGDFAVILVDDRSEDGTADVARKVAEGSGAAHRLTVVPGADLPQGWVGKVWALAQGASYCGVHDQWKSQAEAWPMEEPGRSGLWGRGGLSSIAGKPQYLLLTDADIRHAPGSLRRLVAESEKGHLALNSRMARLRCVSSPERLLIPAFVFFFNLLYPMRRVNDRRSSVAAAAGGCVLVAASALERAGGFACIKDKIIDDVNLARQIKRVYAPIHLTLSRSEVQSLRTYDSLAAIWGMVRRTAFTELRYSWLRLAGTLAGLVMMFLLPPLLTVSGAGFLLAGIPGWLAVPLPWAGVLAAEGCCAWALTAVVYQPAVRFFGLPGAWSWTLPFAGVLYGAMTVDSALRHVTGAQTGWRDR